MNVFIREKESGNYYNFFDVSTINISIREFSEEKYAIDIHIFNNTFHAYANILRAKYEKHDIDDMYCELDSKIRTEKFVIIACDSVHAMPVSSL